MLVLKAIANGLACDCGVCMVLIMTDHYFRKILCHKNWVVLHSVVYLVCSIIETYYFLLFKKNIEQLCQNIP